MSLDGRSAPSSAAKYTYPTTAEMPSPIPPQAAAASQSSSSPAAHDRNRSQLSTLERFAVRASDSQFNALAGAVGGFTSGIVTCPLDVIKTKLQAQGGMNALRRGTGAHVGQPLVYNGLVGTASVIWRNEGLRGMYRGLGPIILGYLPTWAVWFTVYNKSKTWVSQHQSNTFAINFWSSIIAGASSTVVTNPIWVIKTRLMSQTGHHNRARFSWFPRGSNTPTSRPTTHMHGYYHSTFDAAKKMYTSEGVRAFYSGLTPALLGLTHVAVQFPAYEYLKTRFTGQGMGASPANSDGKGHWSGILCASILSKIMASSATYPHEVIRTRLQTQRRPVAGSENAMSNLGGIPGVKQTPGQPPSAAAKQAAQQAEARYKGIARTFQTILREEGWRAFYAGMGTNMMRAVPAATVTMLTYEYVMGQLNNARVQGRGKKESSRREDPSFA